MGIHIDFANDILKSKKIKGKQRVYYIPRKYKKMGYYDIMTDISEHITLVQLVDSLVNVNRAISVVGYWIFDSNYEKSPVLNRDSLDMIFSPSVCEEQVAEF